MLVIYFVSQLSDNLKIFVCKYNGGINILNRIRIINLPLDRLKCGITRTVWLKRGSKKDSQIRKVYSLGIMAIIFLKIYDAMAIRSCNPRVADVPFAGHSPIEGLVSRRHLFDVEFDPLAQDRQRPPPGRDMRTDPQGQCAGPVL